ncbi:MAG: hypothetical protein ABR538_08985 [Candidatus Binatia bacterium]
MLAASLLSGCSVTWGEGGITDVLFGGKPAAEIAPQPGDQPPATAAEAAAASEQGAPPPALKQEEEDGERSLRKIAVLPVAYSDAAGGQPCDLCPGSLVMKPTTKVQARLLTGFIYEAVSRHPRILFPTPESVDLAVQAAPGRSFRQAMASLAAAGRADYVIAIALLELRPRVGPDDAPEQPAGAAIYASLLHARSGEVLWSDTFDENESSRGIFLGAYDKVMNDKPVRWRSAEEFSEYGADELIEDLVDELD